MKYIICICTLFASFLSLSGQEHATSQRLSQNHTQSFKAKDHVLEYFIFHPETPSSKMMILLTDGNQMTGHLTSIVDSLQRLGIGVIVPKYAEVYSQDRELLLGLIQKLHFRDRYQILILGVGQGGDLAFELATKSSLIEATFVFYAYPRVKPAEFSRIQGPVFGFYGENDPITQTISSTRKYMRANGKVFQPIIYEGAEHGFMDFEQDRGDISYNQRAKEAASNRLYEIVLNL
ncbi:MAG: dienelactone hydrolase family protein [Bacteroidota bacterium]